MFYLIRAFQFIPGATYSSRACCTRSWVSGSNAFVILAVVMHFWIRSLVSGSVMKARVL